MSVSKYGPPASNQLLIELHVPDFLPVKEFYQKLGFKVVWERPPEGFKGYLVLQMGSIILCFWAGNEYVNKQKYFSNWPHKTKRGYGVELVIMVEDIESFFSQVKPFANVVEELKMQPWGLKDFRVEDPFGYYLRFTSHHNILDIRNAVE